MERSFISPTSETKEAGVWIPSQLQTNLDFLEDFIDHCNHANNRILVQNFYIEYGTNAERFEQALTNAAKRGVNVQLQSDGYRTLVTNGEPNIKPIFGTSARQIRKQKQANNAAMFEYMQTAGVEHIITNKPRGIKNLMKEIGRNHDKRFIVDDVAWSGGVNINDGEFKKIDFMVKLQDPRLVSVFSQTFDEVNDNKPDTDYEVDIYPYYTFMVDRGDHGKSLIYDRAVELLEEDLSNITYITQIPPSGRFLDALLKKAQTGTEIELILPKEGSHYLADGLHGYMYREFRKNIGYSPSVHITNLDSDVHAKLLQVTHNNGQRVAQFGSHNLSQLGVWAGTQESAFRTTDPDLNDQFEHYIDNLLTSTG